MMYNDVCSNMKMDVVEDLILDVLSRYPHRLFGVLELMRKVKEVYREKYGKELNKTLTSFSSTLKRLGNRGCIEIDDTNWSRGKKKSVSLVVNKNYDRILINQINSYEILFLKFVETHYNISSPIYVDFIDTAGMIIIDKLNEIKDKVSRISLEEDIRDKIISKITEVSEKIKTKRDNIKLSYVNNVMKVFSGDIDIKDFDLIARRETNKFIDFALMILTYLSYPHYKDNGVLYTKGNSNPNINPPSLEDLREYFKKSTAFREECVKYSEVMQIFSNLLKEVLSFNIEYKKTLVSLTKEYLQKMQDSMDAFKIKVTWFSAKLYKL